MRAVIVEDQALLRDALTAALTGRGVDVVGLAQDQAGAVRTVEAYAPDLVLLDIRLPPTHTDEGIRIAELLRARHPTVGLLVLSSFAEASFAERLVGLESPARAIGYLLKDRVGDLTHLIDAMNRVAAGEVVIDSAVIEALMTRRPAGNTDGNTASDPLSRLTAHERRILALVAQGRSNLGIADEVGSRVSTVEKHLSVITDKLGLPSTSDRERPGVNVRVLATLTFLRTVDSQVSATTGAGVPGWDPAAGSRD